MDLKKNLQKQQKVNINSLFTLSNQKYRVAKWHDKRWHFRETNLDVYQLFF